LLKNGPNPGQRRDTQRSKVYAAGRAIELPYKHGVCPDPKLRDIEQCQAFVTKLQQSAWYRRTFPQHRRPVTVKHGGGCSSARACGSGMIELPAWSRQKAVILHELAHCILTAKHDRRAADHGWEFCAIHLQLVQHVMGLEAAAKLKAAFKSHGVRFRPKRVVILTPEQRAAAAERFAAYRAAKAAAINPPAPMPAPVGTATPDRRFDIALARADSC
jgi:putative metallohydrolase (TIGR04338 family)